MTQNIFKNKNLTIVNYAPNDIGVQKNHESTSNRSSTSSRTTASKSRRPRLNQRVANGNNNNRHHRLDHTYAAVNRSDGKPKENLNKTLIDEKNYFTDESSKCEEIEFFTLESEIVDVNTSGDIVFNLKLNDEIYLDKSWLKNLHFEFQPTTENCTDLLRSDANEEQTLNFFHASRINVSFLFYS